MDAQVLWGRPELVVTDRLAQGVRDRWLFFSFGEELRTGFVCEEKEWVSAFNGAQTLLHTCLCSRIDLGVFSHGWKRDERNTNLASYIKSLFMYHLCVVHMGQISALLYMRLDVYVCCRNAFSLFFSSFLYYDTPWFNCSTGPC